VAVAAWIRAEQDPAVDLGALADRLVSAPPAATPEERAQRAVEHLATTDRPWLLVFDNADDPARLRSCIPTAGPGQVLITTRSRQFHRLGTLVPVDEFDTRTAVRYLLERAPTAGDAASARELAETLGYLPLALAHAAGYCADGTTFAEYLEFLHGLPARELFLTDPEASHERTVASTWQPSIAAAGRVSALAPVILGVAAHLAPDKIPVELFGPLADEPDTVRGRKQLADALNALRRYSLIERSGDTFDVHRLLHRIVREDHAGEPEVGSRVLDLLRRAVPDDPRDPAAWPTFRRLQPHLEATLATPPDLDAHRREQHVRILNLLTRFLSATRRDDVPVAERTAGYAARHLRPDAHASLTSRSYLATAYWTAGRTDEAVTLFGDLLTDCEQAFGPNAHDTLDTRNNLALAQLDAGRPAEAVTLLERVVADKEWLLGDPSEATLVSRHNLALAYHLDGRTDDALALMERVVAGLTRLLGGDHPASLTAGNELAVLLMRVGRPDDAQALLQRVLADRERVLGLNHPDTLATRHNLACLHHALGRAPEALALMARVVDDRRQVLGPDHADTVASVAELETWRGGAAADASS
jgi:tetratricopeptide (TPR) repeat protein